MSVTNRLNRLEKNNKREEDDLLKATVEAVKHFIETGDHSMLNALPKQPLPKLTKEEQEIERQIEKALSL